MKFTSLSLGLVLFAALGAVASPVDAESANRVEAREDAGEANILIKYDGTCDKNKNECKYKAQSGKTAFCKCQVKKCGKTGGKCFFDSANRQCTCY
ncbi:hypothetical protein BDV29DRAFT_156298 [Aspergillus leporis]|uniref:Antifungal protein n=1 Tax=Aspergillus leporis TaxID=41062 RepID=A0A5N5X5Z5_9EURO|nr:hypothetical protein BDV29DRAFT_156298 [Aspergillus leporis]